MGVAPSPQRTDQNPCPAPWVVKFGAVLRAVDGNDLTLTVQ